MYLCKLFCVFVSGMIKSTASTADAASAPALTILSKRIWSHNLVQFCLEEIQSDSTIMLEVFLQFSSSSPKIKKNSISQTWNGQ